MSDYGLIDPQIRAWAKRHELKVSTGEVRNAYLSSINGGCFEIWVDRPADGRVTVHAAVENQGVRQFPKAWSVPITDFDKALELAFKTAASWMGPSERYQPKTNQEYRASWRDLRRRRIIVWGVFFGYIPGVVILSIIVGAVKSLITGDARTGNIFPWIAFLWMVAWPAAIIWHASFRCPRCNQPFVWRWGWSNAFTRRCVHCGLRTGAHPTR